MKLNLLLLGLLMVASTSWPVQTFTIEDDDLQKCEFVGKAVDLDGDGQTTNLIVTTQDASG